MLIATIPNRNNTSNIFQYLPSITTIEISKILDKLTDLLHSSFGYEPISRDIGIPKATCILIQLYLLYRSPFTRNCHEVPLHCIGKTSLVKGRLNNGWSLASNHHW